MLEFGDEIKSAVNSPPETDLFDLSTQSSRFENLKWAAEVAQMKAAEKNQPTASDSDELAKSLNSNSANSVGLGKINFLFWGIVLMSMTLITGICCQFLTKTQFNQQAVQANQEAIVYASDQELLEIRSAALTPALLNEKVADQ